MIMHVMIDKNENKFTFECNNILYIINIELMTYTISLMLFLAYILDIIGKYNSSRLKFQCLFNLK